MSGSSLGLMMLLNIWRVSASGSPQLFCESPAVCVEAVCQLMEDAHERAGSSNGSAVADSTQREVAYLEMKRVCPPDRNDIGRAMWTILHTSAAYYPQNATNDQQRTARAFITALPELYPCKDCASHLARALDEMPPRLETREDFSLWVCALHNQVNARTGKAARQCTLRELDEEWRTSSVECIDAREKLRAVTTHAE